MSTTDYTQEGRRLSLETALGTDVLLVTSFNGREEMSRLSVYQIQMVSETPDIDPMTIVGTNVTLNLPLPDGTDRFFNGFINRFACRGSDDRLTFYRAEIVPWLWFLTRSANCKIFQFKTVVDIIKAVFSGAGFTDFETGEIQGSHPQREYCVQYRETDFAFVSRLMEEEGIYYYFRHEQGKHTMVMADQPGGYYDCTESQVSYANNLSAPDPLDLITSWEHRFEFRSGAWTYRDYNFKTPSNDLTSTKKTVSHVDTISNYELYDYPGKYDIKPDGDTLTKTRMEEVEVACEVVSGGSRCRSFTPGGKFIISSHHLTGEEGKGYVITAIEHSVAVSGSYESGSTASTVDYHNTFECIPDSVVFRPLRLTPKPFIRGNQTAVVCGPAGQEIYVDEYGRVKVQFFWDRIGVLDENSSCWIRVGQIWAGNQWGAFYWPRISQEVVVSFLEGDPDRPLITGSVYNAERMPPYPLPAEKTKSGIKSDSSSGSGGFNEIRFEDKKGSEQIFIHGEKNQDINIKKDCFESIGNDRHLTVGGSLMESISADRNESIGGDHKVSVAKDENFAITGKEAKTVGGSFSLKVTGNVTEVFGAKHSEQVTSDYYLQGDNVVIEGKTSLTIKVGGSYVTMDASGITIGTSGTLELKSDGKMSLTGSADVDIAATAAGTFKAGPSLALTAAAVQVNG